MRFAGLLRPRFFLLLIAVVVCGLACTDLYARGPGVAGAAPPPDPEIEIPLLWWVAPIGISLSLGIIFSYSTITGNWRQWVFLWTFLVLLIVGSVLAAKWLARRDDTPRMCRLLGLVLGAMSLAWGVIIALMALVMALFR